jgi:hypothetical protein
VPRHLDHDERPQGEAVRFYALVLLCLATGLRGWLVGAAFVVRPPARRQ